MKKIIMGAALVCLALTVAAQEYKVSKSNGKLQINTGRVTVEPAAGNEIIFSLKNKRGEVDKRAEGLRAINSLGLDDNTGLGVHVAEKDGVLQVYQLKKMDAPELVVQVPKNVIVLFQHESQYGGTAAFKNLENEIEVSTSYNNVVLENVTGPATIKTVYGNVDAVFSQNVKGPVSIVSIYGHVDATLPTTIKANLKMTTSYGDIFASPEFKIDVERDGDMIKYSDRVSGKINGGGMAIDFRSDYGKIYLRKK